MRRLKLVTALSLFAALSLALVILAMIVSYAARRIADQRVDGHLQDQVAFGLEQVLVDAGGDVVVPTGEAQLTSASPQLYVVQDDRVVMSPTAPRWPDVDVVALARQAVGEDPRQRLDVSSEARTRPSGEMQRLRMLAAPVLDAEGRPVAAVVGVADTATSKEALRQLDTYVWWSAGALLALGLVVAVLLARGRFWLVDRAIAEHEQFLHDTAHELRGPIATLTAITDAGLSGQEPPHRALELAAGVLHRTDEVIDDLVALARVEVGRDELAARPLRLDLLVDALVSQRRDDPPVRLATDPTIVQAQANLVRRAVGNLIDNAVRHGRIDDPQAEVSVTVAEGSVTVADRGPGVSPAVLSRFTARAQNGRRRRRSRGGGLGLGLATAQWVATVHGGELDVTNRRGGGARFTLRVPETERG